ANGVQIIGLTEAGAKLSTIEVPAELDGKPVLAIAEGAFSTADSLTRLILNDSLTFIANGAFDSCNTLTSIVLRCSEPSQIRVDEEMLRGAEGCVIYVPVGTYGAYANDYYWAYFCDLGVVAESDEQGK
ncbi:MAG: hypothetical protein ACI3XR_03235, partial [Eubacteriales bacterium]